MKLTLVLSTQRSGSSLLAQHVFSIGGLGTPGEHMIPLFGQNLAKRLSEADVLKLLRRGIQPDTPDVTGLKLMVNQTPRMIECLNGAELPQAEATAQAIIWLRARFETVNLLLVTRENTLDQAISRVLARQTKIFHVTDQTTRQTHAARLKTLDLPAIVARLPKVKARVEQEQAVVTQIAKNHADIALNLTYDQICSAPDAVGQEIRAKATKAGMRPGLGRQPWHLKKVLDEEIVQKIKDLYSETHGAGS